jgi:hypothetical protein
MVKTLIKLEVLKRLRGTSFARSLAIGILMLFVGILLLGYLFLFGLFLNRLVTDVLEKPDAIIFINSNLLYFFLLELIYRYFIQQLPVINLENYLHLPIPKSGIIHALLVCSFLSPLNIVALLIFGPFAFVEVMVVYSMGPAMVWLGAIVLTSWSMHWFVLWFKQRFEDSLTGTLVVFSALLISIGSNYFGLYDLGGFFEPVFTFALENPAPIVLLAIAFILSYFLCFAFYRQNAYLEELAEAEHLQFANQDLGFLSKFGLAGEMANLEWKLIIRHKKSRTYLMLCLFFLLYGLIFYTNPAYQEATGFSYLFIFVGTFITGIFMLQYGQLFLSWNSPTFDFYTHQKNGLRALVKGKYLLFSGISFACFILSVPYVYFGWNVLFIHLATFLFNMGVTIHLVIYLALWKPKPMNLNKGSVFNYEGMGLSQFLMIIPLIAVPYMVFLPVAYWFGDYVGLLALSIIGAFGLLVFPKISTKMAEVVVDKKYEISAAFRQEL